MFPQRWFRENLKLGEGGEEGIDNDIARATYERTGASVMGKRMFRIRLFDRVDPDRLALNQARTAASTRVTHLTYTAEER